MRLCRQEAHGGKHRGAQMKLNWSTALVRWLRKRRIKARQKALCKLWVGGAVLLYPNWDDEEFERAVYGDVLREIE